MDFRLVEFLSFRPKGACFLIPTFILGNGAAAFAQVVNEQGLIEDFRPIEAEGYHSELVGTMGEVRRVGELGLFAVRLIDGRLLHGDYRALKKQLVETDLKVQGSPFFNVDAYAFIEDLAKRKRAAATASILLGNDKIAREWRKLEAVSSGKGLRPVRSKPTPARTDTAGIPETHLVLANTFSTKHWQRRWITEWRTHRNRKFLRDLALRWAESGYSRDKASIIYPVLLQERPIHREVVDSALRWLDYAPWHLAWGIVWDAVFEFAIQEHDQYPSLRGHLLQDVSDYLKRRDDSVIAARWAMIWSKLYRIMGDQQELLDMALGAMHRFEADISFQKRVLGPLFHDHRNDRHFDEEVVLPWMEANQITTTWITAFTLYHQSVTDALVEKARRFIFSKDYRFSAWPILWRAMRPHEDQVALDGMAIGWLHSVSPKTKTWPEFLIEMLNRRPGDPTLVKLAQEYAIKKGRKAKDGVLVVTNAAQRKAAGSVKKA